MLPDLPQPIADYFRAAADAEAVARCFAEDAVVVDERRTHIGRDAIRRWKAESVAKYTYSCRPFAVAPQAERILVTAHVAGDFPGSPVDLRYAFTLGAEAIARLEIGA